MVNYPKERGALSGLRLKNFLDKILLNDSAVSTFILNNVSSNRNMLAIKLKNVTTLQWFAEQTTKPELKFLKTRPVRLQIKAANQFHSPGHNFDIKVAVVPKIFLNGARNATGQFISVCVSCVNEQSQNLLEDEELIVSLYLKNPNIGEPAYRKDFKMRFSAELEQNERGLFEFISKKDFAKFVSEEDCVTFGVMMQLAPRVPRK
ncbi:uncharacterized protein LOC142336873 isoform X2 [Convolutriloba macropyga]|uniref:uncharacterized protein LOC142336873 isoform X2 n=1 Tax=Convolutriloba macropyga TaxID=536237 RepID=UPI003F520B96